MKFLTPVLQSLIVLIVTAILGGAWKVYADVQDVKTKVGALRTQMEGIPDKLDEQIDQRINRRLADVPLCLRQ